MRHERILKREDGRKVKITVSLHIDHSSCTWRIEVDYCAAGKRTWIDAHNPESYEYRRLGLLERAQWKLDRQLLHVTIQEIHDTKVELIGKIPV